MNAELRKKNEGPPSNAANYYLVVSLDGTMLARVRPAASWQAKAIAEVLFPEIEQAKIIPWGQAGKLQKRFARTAVAGYAKAATA